jgi:hypothetical protein
MMNFALIGAAAVAAAAFATPALAQRVIQDPGYCAHANCQNLGPGTPYADVGYYRGDYWQNGMATHSADNNAYRYHGGPKYND